MTTNHQIDRLLTLMQRLRDPENGCPWDKEQTFASIAPYTLEETYEVLDAIAREDFDDLRGELGDLLFRWCFTRRWRRKKAASILMISALPSATSWSAAIRMFLASFPRIIAKKH